MLHKRGSEAFLAKENSDKSISSDIASSPIKKRRIDITDSASDKSSIVASGSTSVNSVVQRLDMAFGNSNRQEIDEDLHSRQLAVYDRETMRRLFASNVLISGMHGLGAEIAKNLILAVVKSVTLHDESVVELWDLSSNFVFSEDDVGKNRADASVQKLQDLNNVVVVSSLTTSLTKEHLSGFEVQMLFNHRRTASDLALFPGCVQCAHGQPTTFPLVNLKALHKQIKKLSSRQPWHGFQRREITFDRAKGTLR